MSLEEEEIWTHSRTLGAMHTPKKDDVRTWQEGGDPQAKERGSEETKRAYTYILGFQPPEMWENQSLLFKPPSLWYFYGNLSKLLHCPS